MVPLHTALEIVRSSFHIIEITKNLIIYHVRSTICINPAEYLIREDCNFLAIDWRTAQKPNYYTDVVESITETGLHTRYCHD